MKQSDQILSRRFLCSLVLLIKQRGSVPLFCVSSFLYQSENYGKQSRYSILLRGQLFLSRPVGFIYVKQA